MILSTSNKYIQKDYKKYKKKIIKKISNKIKRNNSYKKQKNYHMIRKSSIQINLSNYHQ